MQIIREKTVDELIGDVKTNKFKIGEDSMGIIIDSLINLYSDPIGSIVREVTSNCYDAHREKDLKVAGTIPITDEDDPKWFHPTSKKPQIEFQEENVLLGVGNAFLFRDFGVGLSKKRVEEIYTLFGNSTKRDDNNQIGGFGIGAKSPFSYTDTFYIMSKHNGKTFNYMLYRGNDAFHMDLLKEGVTTELNSTEVIIPLDEKESYRDIKRFIKAINNQLMYFEDLQFINVEEGGGRKLKKATIDYEDQDLLIDLSQQHEYNVKEVHLIVGRVRYPLNHSMFEDGLWERDEIPCGIKFDVGELDLVPSREAIRYTDRTKNAILTKVKSIKKTLKSDCEAELACTENWITWLKQASALKANSNRWRNSYDSIFAVKSYLAELKDKNVSCNLHGQTLSGSLLDSEYRATHLFTGFSIYKVTKESSNNYIGGYRLSKTKPSTEDLIKLPFFFQQQIDPESEESRKVFLKSKDLFILNDQCPDGFIQIRRDYSILENAIEKEKNLFNVGKARTIEGIREDFNAMSILVSHVKMVDYDNVVITDEYDCSELGTFENEQDRRKRLGKAFIRRIYFQDSFGDTDKVKFSNSEYEMAELEDYKAKGGIVIYGNSKDNDLLKMVAALYYQAGKYGSLCNYSTKSLDVATHPVIILKAAVPLNKQLTDFINVNNLAPMEDPILVNWYTARLTAESTDNLCFFSIFEKLNSDLYYKWKDLKTNHEDNYQQLHYLSTRHESVMETLCKDNDCVNHKMLKDLKELELYSKGLNILKHLEFAQLDKRSKASIPSKEVFLDLREYLRFKGKAVVKFKKQKKKVEKLSTTNN